MPYLDHAATTPMLPAALAAMTEHLAVVGNPSSLHAAGRRARRVVEESRESLAGALGARPSEVVLTSGGTEADNLAVKGIFWSRRAADPRRRRVLVSAVEPPPARAPAADWLAAHEGAEVVRLPVDREGRVSPQTLAAAISAAPETVALVSVMWANNEVGTVQPVIELAEIAHAAEVPIHSDAVQAVGQLRVDFAASGLDAMTVTAHKLGGPVGVGALLARPELDCTPLLHGGGQERDVRSGTLDAPGVAAFAVAVAAATSEQPARAVRLATLRDDLLARLAVVVPDMVVNGAPAAGRLPGNAHVSFPGCEGDSLLMLLDARGIECSTGSACSAGVPQPSHVLVAMGVEDDLARASLRFSFGHTSTAADVDAVVEAVGPVVERARRAGLAVVPAGA